MANRRILAAGVLSLALIAGIGAWWLVGYLLDRTDATVAELYKLQLLDSDGRAVNFAALRGKPMVVNFWASWCAPCREEMPLLDHTARSEHDIQVVGIGIDDASHVREFLAKAPVSYPLPLTSMAISPLMTELGNPANALPFTAFIRADGSLAGVKLGALKPAELQAFLSKLRH